MVFETHSLLCRSEAFLATDEEEADLLVKLARSTLKDPSNKVSLVLVLCTRVLCMPVPHAVVPYMPHWSRHAAVVVSSGRNRNRTPSGRNRNRTQQLTCPLVTILQGTPGLQSAEGAAILQDSQVNDI